MTKRNGRAPATRSRLAMAVLKGGLGLGAVWALMLLWFAARAAVFLL